MTTSRRRGLLLLGGIAAHTALLLVPAMACAPPEDGARAAQDVASSVAVEAPAAPRAPAPAPDSAVGDYAADGDTLIVREREGRIEALLGGTTYPLTAAVDGHHTLEGSGARAGQRLRFEAGGAGAVEAVVLGGERYVRLGYGAEGVETFRIDPVRPVSELREPALRASPPVEDRHLRTPDLVDLAELDANLRFDIRYATTNNFMGSVFYEEPRAFLQRPAAEALARAARRLEAQGFGLLVFDAYRPWFVTWMFWQATPPAQRMFVANPANGSRHNRGAAVDLTLYDLATGEPVLMPSGYDEFSLRAFPDYAGGTTEQRRNRETLRRAMEAEGFQVYYAEWWHYDHRDWRRYPILNVPFDRLADAPAAGRLLPP